MKAQWVPSYFGKEKVHNGWLLKYEDIVFASVLVSLDTAKFEAWVFDGAKFEQSHDPNAMRHEIENHLKALTVKMLEAFAEDGE